MADLIWTEKAARSLEDIAEFISSDSIFYAKKTIKDIYLLTEALKNLPYIGRYVPEYRNKDIRELIYKTYRIIYKVENNKVTVLTVISGYKDLSKIEL